jgi:hypothetical protein
MRFLETIRSRINQIAILVSLALLALPCVGDSSGKKTMIFGYRTCEMWTKDRIKNASGEYSLRKTFDDTWLLGFISGINAATSTYFDNPMGNVDSTIIFDWMDKYCAAHPDRDISDGGIELFNKLVDFSKKKSPAPMHEPKPDPSKSP